MREKSELQAARSAKMRRLEQPSLTVESKPESVVNTASPGRPASWICHQNSCLRRDLQLAESKLQQGRQSNAAPAQSLSNTADRMTLQYHQHSGESENLKKKSVSYLENL